MASFKVETLIPQVDLHSVWHGSYNIAGAFQNPLSLGVTDIMFSWLSSHLFVLFSASLGKKIVSSVFKFLASTSQTEPVVLHAMSRFGDPPHANTSKIHRYVFRALDWFIQLPDIYLSVCPWGPLMSTLLKLNSLPSLPPDFQLFLHFHLSEC